MSHPITLTLPDDVELALEEVSRNEGLRPEEVIGTAIREHLVLRQFRLLRERLSAKARQQGIVTDQDVFDLVS